jgi:hypothetical protein
MLPTHTPRTTGDGRAVKPHVYMLPVVRPLPPRPTGDAVRTW